MIAGSLVDVAFPDLLQLLHMSGRSGTLYLERGSEAAFISFHSGRIASAYCPTSVTVASVLEERGRVGHADLERARAIHESDPEGSSLGQVLLQLGAVRLEDLRDAVAHKIEHTVYELVSWRRGTFRFVVEEVRHDDELLFAPGELVGRIELDTQVVLVEALRLADEHGESRPSLSQMRRAVPAPPPPPRIDVATSDGVLFQTLGPVLEQVGVVRPAPWREAGKAVDEDPTAIVVADCRGDARAVGPAARLLEEHPLLALIAIVDRPDAARAAYASGAVAVVPPDPASVAACCASVLRIGGRPARATADAVMHARLTRLRELQQDVRALASTKLSVNVMSLFASMAERGILFAVRRDTLVALTAYGRSDDGSRLADTTRGLSLVLETDGPVAVSFSSGGSVPIDWDRDAIPDGLRMIAGRPSSGQGLMVPVLGARRSIAVVYADNGTRPEPILDAPVLELACGLFGLAIENEILRRQIER